MSDLDFATMKDEIRRQPVESYAPKRAAQQVAITQNGAPADEEALTEDIKQNALRVTTMIGNLRERESRANMENSDLKARLEQSDIRITAILSELESMRLKYEAEHAERVRLRATFENVGGLVADALHSK